MDLNPCGICGVHVLEIDEAIQCDGLCSLWHHRECLAMTLEVYLTLSQGYDDWFCRKCIVTRVKRESLSAEEHSPTILKMGKTKICCKKLDAFDGKRKCVFCKSAETDDIKYGPIYAHKNITTHYYCLLLSSNMEQNGRDDEGILGFLPNDINKEVKRGVRLFCSFCRSGGATLGCAISKCKVVFHLPCGIKHGTLHQFFGAFKSFCAKHRPVQEISQQVLSESSKGAMCGICYDKVTPRPIHETLWAPCCQKSAFFHRDCVQRLAISAGYFFKCPLCNNTSKFQQAMKDFGIYIPEQDASWECVPQAYQDLLVRHDTCDSAKCICPSGRKTNVSGTRWELILCKFCGSQGIHIGCGRLKWKSPEFECDDCSGTTNEQSEGNTRNYNGNRHRISGRAAVLHPSVSADREADSDSSSDDAQVTITNSRSRKKKVVSPLPSSRELSMSPPPEKRSRHEKTLKKTASSTVVSETTERRESDKSNSSASITVVDDSDEDIEVVSVSNTDSGFVKDRDGRTIPVVQVKGKQKRPKAENDLQILPDEIVDITKKRNSRKSMSVSPPPLEEMVYSLRPSQPSTSSTFSQPSTSFAPPPDLSRFVLVDPSTLRPEDLPPGTMLYRSVRPIVNVTQPQIPSNVPMQQLGVSNDAVTKHTNISQHWSRVFEHNCPKHIGECPKKLSRSHKCNCARRRRRRRCDNNRLNPRIILSPMQFRRLENGFYEILVSERNVGSGPKKRKASSPLRPAILKKVKKSPSQPSNNKCKSSKKSSKKSNIYEYSSIGLDFNSISDKNSMLNDKTKKVQYKSHSIKIQSGIAGYFMPSKKKVGKKKRHGIVVKWESGLKSKIHQPNNIFASKAKKSFGLEKWKCRKIDDYMKKPTCKGINDEVNNRVNVTECSTDTNMLIKAVVTHIIDLTLNNSRSVHDIHSSSAGKCINSGLNSTIDAKSETSDFDSCIQQFLNSDNNSIFKKPAGDIWLNIDNSTNSKYDSDSSTSVGIVSEIKDGQLKGNDETQNSSAGQLSNTDVNPIIDQTSKTGDYDLYTQQFMNSKNNSVTEKPSGGVSLIRDNSGDCLDISNINRHMEIKSDFNVALLNGLNVSPNHTINDDSNKTELNAFNDCKATSIPDLCNNLCENQDKEDNFEVSNMIPNIKEHITLIQNQENSSCVGESIKEDHGSCIEHLRIDSKPSIKKLLNNNDLSLENPVNDCIAENVALLKNESINNDFLVKETNCTMNIKDDMKDNESETKECIAETDSSMKNEIGTNYSLVKESNFTMNIKDNVIKNYKSETTDLTQYNDHENIVTQDISSTFKKEGTICKNTNSIPVFKNQITPNKCGQNIAIAKGPVFGFFPRIKFSHRTKIVKKVYKKHNPNTFVTIDVKSETSDSDSCIQQFLNSDNNSIFKKPASEIWLNIDNSTNSKYDSDSSTSVGIVSEIKDGQLKGNDETQNSSAGQLSNTDVNPIIDQTSKTGDYDLYTQQFMNSKNNSATEKPSGGVSLIRDNSADCLDISNINRHMEIKSDFNVALLNGLNVSPNHTINDDSNKTELNAFNDCKATSIPDLCNNLCENQDKEDNFEVSNMIPNIKEHITLIQNQENSSYVGESIKEDHGSCIEHLRIDSKPSIKKPLNNNDLSLENPVNDCIAENVALLKNESINNDFLVKETNCTMSIKDDMKNNESETKECIAETDFSMKNEIGTNYSLVKESNFTMNIKDNVIKNFKSETTDLTQYNDHENIVTQDISSTFKKEGTICKNTNNIPVFKNQITPNKCGQNIAIAKGPVFGFFPRIKFSHSTKIVKKVDKKHNPKTFVMTNDCKNNELSQKENVKQIKKTNRNMPESTPRLNGTGMIDRYFYSLKKDSSNTSKTLEQHAPSTISYQIEDENGICPSEMKGLTNTNKTSCEKTPLGDICNLI